MFCLVDSALVAELLPELGELSLLPLGLLFRLCAELALAFLKAHNIPLLLIRCGSQGLFDLLLRTDGLTLDGQNRPPWSHAEHPGLQHRVRHPGALKGDPMIAAELHGHEPALGLRAGPGWFGL